MCFGFIKSQNDKPINLTKYDIKPYHFGFSLGFNKFDFHIDPNMNITDSIRPNSDPSNFGFNFGVVANYRLNNFIDLRFIPELSFSKQSLIYYVLNNGSFSKESYSFETSQLNFPLLFKIKYKRLKNYRPYLILGCKYRLDLSRKQTPPLTNQFIQINDNDFGLEVGAGLDIYLKYFKFSPEIDFSLGLKNLNQKNNSLYSRSIDKLTSRVIVLYFYFE